MLELIAIALIQLASFSAVKSGDTTKATTSSSNNTITVEHGSGGWGGGD